jgi:hypothetical protein
VFRHQCGNKVPELLVGDRKTWVLAAGEAVIGVAFAQGRDELGAHAGHTGAVAIDGGAVGDYCGKAARPAAVVVGAGVAVAAATGGGSQIIEKIPEAQLRMW